MNVEETKVAEKISENQAKVDQLTRDWNNKWKETQKIMEVSFGFLEKKSTMICMLRI